MGLTIKISFVFVALMIIGIAIMLTYIALGKDEPEYVDAIILIGMAGAFIGVLILIGFMAYNAMILL